MDYKKIANIIGMVDEYGLPLAEEGVKMTKTPDDDIAVSFFAGGLPAVQKKLLSLAVQTTPTTDSNSQPKPTVTTTHP